MLYIILLRLENESFMPNKISLKHLNIKILFIKMSQ